jgi:hypothetical protein
MLKIEFKHLIENEKVLNVNLQMKVWGMFEDGW